jgi:hypothetical protein
MDIQRDTALLANSSVRMTSRLEHVVRPKVDHLKK